MEKGRLERSKKGRTEGEKLNLHLEDKKPNHHHNQQQQNQNQMESGMVDHPWNFNTWEVEGEGLL